MNVRDLKYCSAYIQFIDNVSVGEKVLITEIIIQERDSVFLECNYCIQ